MIPNEKSPHLPIIPRSNIHLDILMGRDETLHVSDFFGSESLSTPFFRPRYIMPGA